MITAQNIREKTFEKAKFGGYDMSGVDDYLEELAADVTATQKEIGTLRAKMKVLVDKIEEYRANEDVMRKALLSAQKLAAQIEADARAEADAIIAEAKESSNAMLTEANAKYNAVVADVLTARETEERRLSAAKEASAGYFEKAFAAIEKQREFLLALQDVPATEVPAVEEPSEELHQEDYTPEEAAVFAAAEEYAAAGESAAAAFMAEEYATYTEELAEEPVAEEPATDKQTEEEEVDEPTRMFRF